MLMNIINQPAQYFFYEFLKQNIEFSKINTNLCFNVNIKNDHSKNKHS